MHTYIHTYIYTSVLDEASLRDKSVDEAAEKEVLADESVLFPNAKDEGMCVFVCLCMCGCVDRHTHINTYIHTHINTYICVGVWTDTHT